MLGHYSHGTSHSFLGASEGVEFMKTWKLPPPAKIADKLKSALLGEMANAEWELLEEKEWDDLAEGSRDTDTANPASEDRKSKTSLTTATEVASTEAADDTASIRPMRTSPTSTTATTSSSNTTRPSGTSGWTKLKSKQPGT